MNITFLDKYRSRYGKYIDNSLWLFSEKLFALGISFLSTAYIARVYGPTDFGIISYTLSLVSLFAVAGHAGMSGLLVREIVRHPKHIMSTMGNGIAIKTFGYVLGFFSLNIIVWLVLDLSYEEKRLVSLASISLLIQPFCILEFWFQSQMKNKFFSIGKQASTILSGFLKVIVAFFGLSITFVIGISVLQVFVLVLFLLYFFYKCGNSVKHWELNYLRAKNLMGQASLSFLGSIFAIIYLKIDQIMIRDILGSEAVGVYSVAVSLSEVWYFIPSILASVFYPKLISLREQSNKKYLIKLQQLFDLMVFLSFLICALVYFSAELIITSLFGLEYVFSVNLLFIHILALPLISVRAVISKWIMIEGYLLYSLISQGAGAFINILLNYLWIEKYGIIGAAFATVFSYATASYISLLFTKKTHNIFLMTTKAFLIILRYPFKMLFSLRLS